MTKQIVSALTKFWKWLRHWFWEKPVSKPIPEKPIRVMGEQVFSEYMIIEYNGQKINIHRNEIPIWLKMSRKDKRAMANKFAKLEKKGIIRFEMIGGKLICLKNKNYNPKSVKQ